MSTLAQRSFTGGELAEALWARVDTTKYQTGLRTCRNFYIMRHGGAANRPGTDFVAEVKESSKKVRLIPFQFNIEQTYVLEFGHLYIRIHRAGSPVLETAKTISGATKANPCVITSNSHGFSNGDEVQITGLVGMSELNNRSFKVAGVTTNSFSLQTMNGVGLDSTNFGAYVSGGQAARSYTLASPYVEADLATLQFIQSADVLTLVHPEYAPRELSRSGHAAWALNLVIFNPVIGIPTGLSVTPNANAGLAGDATSYKVTAVSEATGEEGQASVKTDMFTSGPPTPASANIVHWSAVAGAKEYNVYKAENGIYGFLGVSQSLSFNDVGGDIDSSDTPPIFKNPFDVAGNFPSTVAYIQQRLMFANTKNAPEKVWGSKIGHFKNFTTSSPIQDDDSVSFTMAGRQVNQVRHLIDLGKLVTFTTGGEWAIDGDAAGIIKPGEINPKQYSYNGSSTLLPIVIGGSALYVQARGSVVRDLGFDYQVDGYRGNDLTIFSAHLFDGFQLMDWAYQQIPHSILWAVRNDGVLIGLTYVREHELSAWHRHDFDGAVENVCVISEGNEDVLYLCIRRTVAGETKRYIERMTQRRIDDIRDAKFMDSSRSYDGRNLDGSHTMTLSGGVGWGHLETLTLQSSTPFFTTGDIGNAVHIQASDGSTLRFTITEFTSSSLVKGKAHKTVPDSLRGLATSKWSRAVDALTGLWHLEGKQVSVMCDGFIVSSPLNQAYQTLTVQDGMVNLGGTYSVIHVGLPYVSDLQTLDIDTPQGETLADKKKRVARIFIHMEKSRGVFAGPSPPTDDTLNPLENLYELKNRTLETADSATGLTTGVVDLNIMPTWNAHGRVFLRQIDPLPLSILAVNLEGQFPFKG